MAQITPATDRRATACEAPHIWPYRVCATSHRAPCVRPVTRYVCAASHLGAPLDTNGPGWPTAELLVCVRLCVGCSRWLYRRAATVPFSPGVGPASSFLRSLCGCVCWRRRLWASSLAVAGFLRPTSVGLGVGRVVVGNPPPPPPCCCCGNRGPLLSFTATVFARRRLRGPRGRRYVRVTRLRSRGWRALGVWRRGRRCPCRSARSLR